MSQIRETLNSTQKFIYTIPDLAPQGFVKDIIAWSISGNYNLHAFTPCSNIQMTKNITHNHPSHVRPLVNSHSQYTIYSLQKYDKLSLFPTLPVTLQARRAAEERANKE